MNQLADQIEAARERVVALNQRLNKSRLSQLELLATALEELHTTLEELQNADEELYQQNQELCKQNEELTVARQRYEDLFEFAPEGYLMTDADGRIQEANRAAAALLNISQKLLVGQQLITFVAESEHLAFQSQLTQVQPGDWMRSLEVRFQPRGRRLVDVVLTVVAVRNRQGKLIALRWLLRDITERKRAENQIRTLNVQLEQLVIEHKAQLEQALDFEAMLKRISDKVRDSLNESQIWQTAVQELGLVLGVISCKAALYDLNQGTSTVYYEYTTSMPSDQGQVVQMANSSDIYQPLLQGQYFQFCSIDPSLINSQVMILACPIFDDQRVLGDLFLLNHQDYVFNELEIRLVQQVANQCAIAVRQARLYQASRAQVMELEKLNRLKDDFISTVSYELRTPVHNINMAIQMLKLAPTAEKSQRYMEILEAECTRETSLINDLLDLQKRG